jgi:hypothetical protein
LLLAAVLLMSTIPGAAADGPRPLEEELLQSANKERGERGLAPLRWNRELARLARLHSADMKSAQRLSHLCAADSASYKDRLIAGGLRPRLAKENVAMGPDIPGIHRGLMRSKGHRAAILDPGLEEVGIGVVSDEAEGLFWVTQDFASLMPDLDDTAARAAIRQALADAWQSAGAPVPREKKDLSRKLGETLDEMVRRDRVSARLLSVPPPAWVFAYTTDDPARLPEDIRAKAGQAGSYALAVGFRRTAATPMGIFWVAMTLTDPVGKP